MNNFILGASLAYKSLELKVQSTVLFFYVKYLSKKASYEFPIETIFSFFLNFWWGKQNDQASDDCLTVAAN